MSNALSFSEVNHLLVPMGSMKSPSEFHGWICGQLCGGRAHADEELVTMAFKFLDLATDEGVPIGSDSDLALTERITAMMVTTHRQLEDEQLGFSPLLPDDSQSLALRLGALAEWCHGYLQGFAQSGIAGDHAFSSETAEGLRDIAAIVGVAETGDAEALDEDERDFQEVADHVGIVALHVFLDVAGQVRAQQPSSSRIH